MMKLRSDLAELIKQDKVPVFFYDWWDMESTSVNHLLTDKYSDAEFLRLDYMQPYMFKKWSKSVATENMLNRSKDRLSLVDQSCREQFEKDIPFEYIKKVQCFHKFVYDRYCAEQICLGQMDILSEFLDQDASK